MKLVSSSLLVAFAFSLSAAAPPPPVPQPAASIQQARPDDERIALARRYISRAVSPDQYLDIFRVGMAKGLSNRCDCSSNADDKDASTAMMTRFLALYEPKVRERMPNVMEAYALAYAREFSADELRAMVAFADTPAGAHFLSRRTTLDLDPAVLMQEEGFTLDALPILQQIEKEKCAEHTAKRIAAGDKTAKCPLADKDDTRAG